MKSNHLAQLPLSRSSSAWVKTLSTKCCLTRVEWPYQLFALGCRTDLGPLLRKRYKCLNGNSIAIHKSQGYSSLGPHATCPRNCPGPQQASLLPILPGRATARLSADTGSSSVAAGKHPLWPHAFPVPFLTVTVPKHSREDEIPMWGWGVTLSWKEGRGNGRVPQVRLGSCGVLQLLPSMCRTGVRERKSRGHRGSAPPPLDLRMS